MSIAVTKAAKKQPRGQAHIYTIMSYPPPLNGTISWSMDIKWVHVDLIMSTSRDGKRMTISPARKISFIQKLHGNKYSDEKNIHLATKITKSITIFGFKLSAQTQSTLYVLFSQKTSNIYSDILQY